MKKLFISVILLLLTYAGYSQHAVPADKVLKEASALAAKEHKNVFIIFHASWCGWCHKMDTAMNDAACKPAFEKNYVIRHITVKEAAEKKNTENPGGMELLTKYNGDKEGIPFWLVFQPDGKLLADSRMKGTDGALHNIGCPAEPAEIAQFLEILKASSHMTADELTAIEKRFGEIARHN
ncbi:thioredoxin family protein [Chitinophaga sp. Cy-1792]|uniref:thioredoxin family protein n=1 Tax=Chitinophaga sp. Cy-1792 TaxID=2608339 RepID=UPI00141FA525|nr:thioredoxin family protein [Chitinophaga sp. Cy-1792]